METAVKEGKYIYCIIEANQPGPFDLPSVGGRGDELHAICHNDISALVSNSPIRKYAVSRENTLAHEKAIEEAMKEYAVLPVRFATIAEDEDTVKKILEEEYDRFKGLLDEFRCKKELGLKVLFKEEVYKEILESHEDIKRLKEEVASKSVKHAYNEYVKIGQMVEQALEEEKERHREEILELLRPLAEDTKLNYCYGERMILNAAFLVNKDRESAFDGIVNELGEKYESTMRFKYIGTVPPFNFVNLIIETGRY